MKFMKLRNLFAAAVIAGVGSVFAMTTLGSSAEPSATQPVFNHFETTERFGDERDFIRVKNTGVEEAYTNSVNDACTDGQEVSIQFYIHNGSGPAYNGENFDGPVVAQGTRASLTKAGDTEISGTISADNAATVADRASITCNGAPVDFTFVPGVAVQSNSNGFTNLPQALFTEAGTPIGFEGTDGVLPACWEYITIVYAKVVVDVPEEVEELPAVCRAIDAVLNQRTLTIRGVEYTERDATVNSITVNYGDGRTETVAPDAEIPTHTYAPGEYNAVVTLNTTFMGETSDVSSKACEFPVTVDEEEEVNPEYACEMFNLRRNERKVTVSFLPTAKDGATFKDATIVYSLDGEEQNTVTTNDLDSDNKVTDMYKFETKEGRVNVVATVRFNVTKNNKTTVEDVTCKGQAVLSVTTEVCEYDSSLPVDSPDCEKEETPTIIPETGAGSTVGILVAVAAMGTYAHRAMTLKRQ